ncbi:protein ERGIC-53 isoform X3 [Salmo trutta]|uniref:protein ERGIC-53 isoform X3 n=1 Tax=Salmo trutta TaxID=8032 RepID=UPI0011307C64|nr:protein ERGIC-53-like isoform X3 [Salmo trutta]
MAVSIGRCLAVDACLLILTLTCHHSNADNIVAGASTEEAPHRRFEYKYSFKGPHLSQTDGIIPFWVHSGNAIPSADQVRITPSLRSQKGSVWTKNTVNFDHWEVKVTFRVSGRGRMGADGLAIWFTTAQGLDGPVYGAADNWNGIGIFFDSFDNDGKKNNPAVLVVGNNGKLVYDHPNDGTTQALGTCLRDFRNKPYPVRAKITYYKKTLTVLINNGFTPDKDDYEFCTKVDNMIIPQEGYFGISAATGGLAGDDHDVLSFLTFRLTEPGQDLPAPEAEMPKEEQDKYQEEFENFQQELDKKKDDYQKEHPEVQREPKEMYESVNDREIRQVFEGQNQIHQEIKQLHRQLAMILDEQSRYVSVVTDEISKRHGELVGQAPSQEMGAVVATQQEILRNLNELRNSFHESLKQIDATQHQANPVSMGTYETVQHFNEIQEHLHVVKRNIEHLITRNGSPSENQGEKCPDPPKLPSCLGTIHFLVFVVIQSGLFLSYIMYKSQQEAAAKKFF